MSTNANSTHASFDERNSQLLAKYRTDIKPSLDAEVEKMYAEIVKIIDEQTTVMAGARNVPKALIFRIYISTRIPNNISVETVFTGNTSSNEYTLSVVDNHSEVFQADFCEALIAKLISEQKFAQEKDKSCVYFVEYDFRTLFGLKK